MEWRESIPEARRTGDGKRFDLGSARVSPNRFVAQASLHAEIIIPYHTPRVSGATPEPARETRALPVHVARFRFSAEPDCI